MRKINEAYENLSSPTSSGERTGSSAQSSASTQSSYSTYEPYDEELEKIHTMYFQQKEADLFQKLLILSGRKKDLRFMISRRLMKIFPPVRFLTFLMKKRRQCLLMSLR